MIWIIRLPSSISNEWIENNYFEVAELHSKIESCWGKQMVKILYRKFTWNSLFQPQVQGANKMLWKGLVISRLNLCIFFLQKACPCSKWKLFFFLLFHFFFEGSRPGKYYEEKIDMHQCLVGFPSPAWTAGFSYSIMASSLQTWWLWWRVCVLWRCYWTAFLSVFQNSSTEGEGMS